MSSLPFRSCVTCGKRVLMEDDRQTCDRCLADRLTTELCAVDLALMAAGWDLGNSPAGALAAKMTRLEAVVPGPTLGMRREDFIAALTGLARVADAPASALGAELWASLGRGPKAE